MDESNVEGELTLEPKVELNGQSKDDLQVPSKREQNRRKRQAHREATRETWLAQKKIKRKQKQLLKRENALKSNPADSSQLVKESNESSVKVEQASPSIAVIFDLGFDDYMLDKEKSSLYLQLCRSYGVNKRASNPVHFILTSVSDKAKEALQRMSVSNWKNVYLFDKHWSLLSQKDLSSIGIHSVVDSIDPTSASLDGSYIRREQFVYLTGDAPETLQTFIPSRFYIIGGIVDKNRHKNLTFLESQKYGILAQKLPIKEESGNIQLQSSTIFTCNQIFELILSFLEKQNWRDALQECIPKRKIVLNS